MRRYLIYSILAFSFIYFYSTLVYSAEDRRLQQTLPSQHQAPSQQQSPRPILPPVVPSGSSGISPTVSPHIASPSITHSTINIPSTSTGSQTSIHNVQSFPINVPMPISNVLPQTPIIGNSMGKVVNKYSGKDLTAWIEVKDEIFSEILKIKINLKNTPIIKKATAMAFKDIKIGDTVSVVFDQQGQEMSAHFVSILTEEDLKALKETNPSPKE